MTVPERRQPRRTVGAGIPEAIVGDWTKNLLSSPRILRPNPRWRASMPPGSVPGAKQVQRSRQVGWKRALESHRTPVGRIGFGGRSFQVAALFDADPGRVQ